MKKSWVKATLCRESRLSLWSSSEAFFVPLADRVAYVAFASFSHCLWKKGKTKCSSNNEAISLATYQPLLPLMHPSRSSTTPAIWVLFAAGVGHCSWPPTKEEQVFWLVVFPVMVPFITMTHIHWLSLAFFSAGFILLFCFEYWCSISLTWLHCQMVSRRWSSSN